MDWREYLFSFEGRAPRWEFWLFLGIGICYAMLIGLAILPPIKEGGISHSAFLMLIIVLRLPLFWPGLAIAVRRLHDRDKGREWAWLFVGLPFGANVLNAMFADALRVMPVFEDMFWLLGWLSFIAALWGFVEMGILRGTVGDNRFGLDPVPPVETTADGRKVSIETPGGHRVSVAITGPDGVVRKEYYYVAESDPERARVLVRNTEGARDADVAVVGTILYQTLETLNLKPGTFIPAPRAKA